MRGRYLLTDSEQAQELPGCRAPCHAAAPDGSEYGNSLPLSFPGDDAVTKDAGNGFKAVYRCREAQGCFQPKAHGSVIQIIDRLFLALLTFRTLTAVTRVRPSMISGERQLGLGWLTSKI